MGLPFYVEDHFFMSGKMWGDGDGNMGGDVAVSDCPMDMGGGPCKQITWTPGGSPWVGFYYQYPDGNWGDAPGLNIEPGATHVRYRVWGEAGQELSFGVGIAGADGFQNDSGAVTLGAEPTEGVCEGPGEEGEG